MKKTKYLIFIGSIAFAILNNSFLHSKGFIGQYGFISKEHTEASKYHYKVVDLDVLKKIDASYGCGPGGQYCEVEVNLSRISITRSGANKEIIEFDMDPTSVSIYSKGYKFKYNY